MREEGTDRQPRVRGLRDRLQRIERRDEDQPIELSFRGKLSADAAADAESNRNGSHWFYAFNGKIMDERRVGYERFGRGRAFRRGVSAIMEGNHVAVREQLVQIFGDVLSVPGVAAEPYNENLLGGMPLGGNMDTLEAVPVGGFQ